MCIHDCNYYNYVATTTTTPFVCPGTLRLLFVKSDINRIEKCVAQILSFTHTFTSHTQTHIHPHTYTQKDTCTLYTQTHIYANFQKTVQVTKMHYITFFSVA